MTESGPQPVRLLVVDDEEAQMKALCDTLRDRDYEVAGFTAGGIALDTLREGKFDLLLADLMMPQMDGIALLQAALRIQPDLVGIIMTGEGTVASAVEAMKVGAVDYILKPFKLSVILPVLSRALTIRQLRMANTALEQRLRERAIELEAANKDLDSFTHSVSHDLRAPLRSISGFAGMLKSGYSRQMPADARNILDRVTISVRRMEQLLEDLLSFSRLGRHAISKRSVSTSVLVQEILQELRKDHVERNIDLHVGDLPDCIGDPSLLRQVFFNLLSNAFKFTRLKQQAVINVGCQEQADENVYYIRDNGAGFDMQYAEKLFGVFQRFHSPQEFEGTGVGLSIVQRIVQRHGGRIWAEAEIDQGATFYFSLPR